VHTFIGNLIVTLVAPDGTTYLLHNRTGGGTDNIDQTYPFPRVGDPHAPDCPNGLPYVDCQMWMVVTCGC